MGEGDALEEKMGIVFPEQLLSSIPDWQDDFGDM